MSKRYTRNGVVESDSLGINYTYTYNLKNYTDLYYLFIGLDMQDINSYLVDMECSNKKIKDEIISRDKYAHAFLISSEYEYYNRVDIRYPFLLRNTVYITLYSLFEDKLLIFLKYVHERLNVDENYDEPKSNININQVIELIGARIDVKLSNIEISLLSNYRLIRNCLVHQRGRVSGNKYEAAKNLKDRGISLIENQRGIYLEKNACSVFSEYIENVFIKLCNALIEKEKLLGS